MNSRIGPPKAAALRAVLDFKVQIRWDQPFDVWDRMATTALDVPKACPMLKTPAYNTLFYGDNLAILREHIEDESVDLVYLDPPFNSNANYNLLFKAPDGHQSQAQIEAFGDSWHWNEPAEQAFDEVMQSGNSGVA